MKSETYTRIWELDFLRGLAICIMVFFHLVYDLNEFYGVTFLSYEEGIIRYAGKFSAALFIFISGVSCTLSRNNIKRGLYLLLIAFGVTLVTYIAVPGSNIIFGILHLLGTSIIMYPILTSFSSSVLVFLGSAVILFGQSFIYLDMPFNYLAPLGLRSYEFYSADYYPLLPWSGIFMYGIAFGKIKYVEKHSLLPFDYSNNFLGLLGRHSLLIYLSHQPVLLGLLYLIKATTTLI